MHKIIKIFGIVAILILLVSIAQADDWPMFHKNPEHTGYTTEKVIPPLKLLWKCDIHHPLFTSSCK
jgi:hypothetical protein